MAQKETTLTMAGVVLAAISQSPADAALAPLPDRPIARIDQIRSYLHKAVGASVDDTKYRVQVQWQNWRRF